MNTKKPIIGIIGTGMIASSMAVLATGHGFKAVVLARSSEAETRLANSFETHWSGMKDQGIVTDDQIAVCRTYLSVTQSYADLKDCEIIYECALEDANVKHDIYHQIEEHCPIVKAICSVSSAIIPDILAETCDKYGDRIIVTHPFNPAHMVPYFELCGGQKTAPGVIEYAKANLEALDRKPVILKKPTPGFIGNRLQFALWREVLALVEEGIADPRDIDTALTYSFCTRYSSIGIFEHFDNGGLTLNRRTCENLFPHLSNMTAPPALLTDLEDAGKLGAKTGEGFYDWNGVDMVAYRARVNEPFWKFCHWNLPEDPAQ